MCDKKPAKAKKCRMFHAKHCYTTNTKLTSTEFTTMHLNLNIQLNWTVLNAHLTLHIVSWMFCNRARQEKQHWLLKQWNYYWSIDLQWKLDAAIGEHNMHAKKPQWHYQLWEGRVKAKTLRIALNKNKLKPNCCSDACGVTLWIEKCACDAKKKNSNGTRTKRMKANSLQHTLNKKQLKPDRCCNTLDSKLFLQNDCILLWIMNTHTSNQIY
jgi:hypothetical protein